MNRLSRTTFRSLLRWNRKPQHIGNPFSLSPASLGIGHLLPAGAKIEGPEGVQAAIYHCFRNHPCTSENMDLALKVLNKLNDVSAVLIQRLETQKNNLSSKVDRLATFRVGQVVMHRKLGVRGVVAGWEVDVEKKCQSLRVIPDLTDLDAHVKRTGAMPTFADSKLFKEVRRPEYKRIRNDEIWGTFSHYDLSVGRYVPREDAAFLYPLDVMGVNYNPTLLSSEGIKAAKETLHLVQEIAGQLQTLLECHFPGVRAEHVSDPFLSDPPETTGQHRRNAIVRQILHSPLDNFFDLLSSKTAPKNNASVLHKPIHRGGDLWAAASTAYGESVEKIHALQAGFPHEAKAVYRALETLSGIHLAIDQMLEIRFQGKGLGFSEALSVEPALTQETIQSSNRESIAQSKVISHDVRPRVAQMIAKTCTPAPKFEVGQLVRDTNLGIRAVVMGYDIRPTQDIPQWQLMGLEMNGLEQPVYRVIPDAEDVKQYEPNHRHDSVMLVFQENLTEIDEPSQKIIRNHLIQRALLRYDVDKGRFIPPHPLRYCFPAAHHALPPDYPKTSLPEYWAQHAHSLEQSLSEEARALLEEEVAVYAQIDVLLLQLRDVLRHGLSQMVRWGGLENGENEPSSSLSNMLTLLKEAPTNAASVGVELLFLQSYAINATIDANVCMRLGLAELRQHKFTAAQTAFENALEVDPNYAEAYNKLATIMQQAGNRHECIELEKEALRCLPHHYYARLGMAVSYYKTMQMQKAGEQLRLVLQTHPWISAASKVLSMIEELVKQKSSGTESEDDEENRSAPVSQEAEIIATETF